MHIQIICKLYRNCIYFAYAMCKSYATMHMISIWFVYTYIQIICNMYMMCIRDVFYLHSIRIWSTYDLHTIYIWFAYDLHMIRIRFAYDSHMIYTRFAYVIYMFYILCYTYISKLYRQSMIIPSVMHRRARFFKKKKSNRVSQCHV